MKKTIATFCIAAMAISGIAQDTTAVEEPWKTGGVMGLNFAQTHLSNWQGGGSNAVSGTAILSLYANYKKEGWTWDNTLDAAYGQTRLGKAEDGAIFQKTDDRIEINSKLGHKTPVKKTYFAAIATFRTQWDAGYDYGSSPSPLISDPFSPAYIMIGTGIDYKPNEKLSIYLSPITGKVTIVDNERLSNMGAFGVTPGETVRYEFGGLLKVQYTQDLMKNVKLSTKADFYANYLENFGNIDVNWETLIAMKINKFLSASLSTHLIYDDDIEIAVDRDGDGITDGSGPRTQFKEVFSLGIQYQFSR